MHRTPRASSTRPTSAAPACVEGLESRQLMSGTIALTSVGSVSIQGTSVDDRATITLDGRGTPSTFDDRLIVRLTTNGVIQGANYAAPAVKLIAFNGFSGNDTFVNGSNIRSFALGGNGNDTLIGGSAADLLSGGADDDRLFGQGGRDSLSGGTGSDRLDSGLDGIDGDIVFGNSGFDFFTRRPGDVTDRSFFELF
jgi:Ca2+-binding RTX toxin-like protein